MVPPTVDEGAGWEAAVEEAQKSTPLIGEEQTKALERINAYFNKLTNLQGSFEQVDATNKQTSGRFYVQRPGKLNSTTPRRARFASSPTAVISPSRIPT